MRQKKKCFFDASGNLYIHNSIKMGGEMIPVLKPKEWFYWLLLTQTRNTTKSTLQELIGPRSTQYRIAKKLKEKGYLPQ